jgi:hypothetical protein
LLFSFLQAKNDVIMIADKRTVFFIVLTILFCKNKIVSFLKMVTIRIFVVVIFYEYRETV